MFAHFKEDILSQDILFLMEPVGDECEQPFDKAVMLGWEH